MSYNPARRGVYLLPWRGRDGESYMAAVNAAGLRICEVTIYPGAPADSIENFLHALLDTEDPERVSRPRLRAVR